MINVKKVTAVLVVGGLALVLLFAIGSGGQATMVTELSLQTPSPQVWAPYVLSGPTRTTMIVPPTATPRDLPAPRGVYLMHTSAWYRYPGSDDLKFTGEVWNNTFSNVELEIDVTLYNGAGEAVATGIGETGVEVFNAGQTSSFRIYIPDVPHDWKTYAMTLTYQETTRREPLLKVPLSGMEMECEEAGTWGYAWADVHYTFSNPYDDPVIWIKEIVTFYDANRRVIFVDWKGTSALGPGQGMRGEYSTAHPWNGWPDCDVIDRFSVQVTGQLVTGTE